CLLVYGGAVLF
nr:immunoglobulin light chain junction region [Macaca mulatta]